MVKADGAQTRGRVVPPHPSYSAMVEEAIVSLKVRKGSSRTAIQNYITDKYDLGDNMSTVQSHLRRALNNGIENGSLRQTTGTGANGSFRMTGPAPARAPVNPPAGRNARAASATESTRAAPAARNVRAPSATKTVKTTVTKTVRAREVTPKKSRRAASVQTKTRKTTTVTKPATKKARK